MTRRLSFEGSPCQLAKVRHAVAAFASESGFDDPACTLIVLAVDEACTNIIRHAYKGPGHPIRLHMTRHDGTLRIVLRDYGNHCDPACIRSRAIEDFRPGGVGVHIIRQIFDTVDYVIRPRGTRLVLTKRLPPTAASP
jgi:anti-sigma regulatory factor (Ser/Thr protein kinase)